MEVDDRPNRRIDDLDTAYIALQGRIAEAIAADRSGDAVRAAVGGRGVDRAGRRR